MKDEIRYTIRKSKRAKRISITVHRNGSVVATVPYNANEKIAKNFVKEKAEWIRTKLHNYSKTERSRFSSLTKKDYIKHKEEVRKIVTTRVEYFSKIYGFSYNKISIRNQTSRWGSCSSKKNLNFNYKIVLLTKEQQDYIIIHEICHLQELNHSPRFWKLVSRLVPNYKIFRKELRKMI